MKNKKGILTKNVLSLLVAVMGIILLIFVSVSIYNSFESQEEKNARAFLDGLMGKIDNLEDGETGVFPMRGVEERYLVGWTSEDDRPDKCFFESCLCVCNFWEDGNSFADISKIPKGKVKELCQNNGFCKDFSSRTLNVKTESLTGAFQGWPKNHHVKNIGTINLYLHSSLINIEIKKDKNELVISKYASGPLSLTFNEFQENLLNMSQEGYYYWEYDLKKGYDKKEEIFFKDGEQKKELRYENYHH